MTNDDRSSSEIERDIERERAELQDTLQEIRDRYSVEAVTKHFGRQLQEHGGEIGRSVMEQVKANPIPLALTGIGLVWLMAGGRNGYRDRYEDYANGYRNRYMRGGEYDYRRSEFGPEPYDDEEFDWDGEEGWEGEYDRSQGGSTMGSMASDAASGAKSMASDAASGAKSMASRAKRMVWGGWSSARSTSGRMSSTASSMLERLYEGTHDMSEEARDRVIAARDAAYQAQKRVEDMMRRSSREMSDLFESQPLVVGALAMAAGAALGGLLPRTNAEDEAMGEERDRLMEEAERIYRQERSKLGAVMGAAASAATEVLREAREEVTAAGPEGESLAEAATNKAKDAARKVADRTREEAERQGVGDINKPSARGTKTRRG
ncbi:MAG: DUF3618 domain-containing protein [Nitratireductor sp.]|nr:DUF3618 domain-containing protein [Nitratireductor sp.]